MEKDDLEKIGISDPEHQQKVLSAVKEMHLDRCCYLIETVQDVISRFPQRASELVLSLNPKKEAQAICNELVAQTGDLQKEVTCLRNLLHK
ncbi:unnamed protein product, partial [Coregonus sp. 'balchen']